MSRTRTKLLYMAVAGLIMAAGVIGALSIAGAFDSGDSNPTTIVEVPPTPTPTPAPEPGEVIGADSGSRLGAGSEPDVDADPDSDTALETPPPTDPDVDSDTAPEPTIEPDQDLGSDTAPEPTIEPDKDLDFDPVPEPTIEPDPDSDTAPEPATEPDPDLDSATTPEPATDADPDFDSDAGPEAVIEPDPDYEAALDRARFFTFGWETDFSLHSVPYDEIMGGGPPRDGIPPIDDPKFVTAQEADEWLGEKEPVIALEIDGDVRAYPLQVLTWHEIVNDEVGGVPVSITFCPLCNAAIVFDRRLDGVVYDFGTSGNLRNSDLIMWDRQTESWWQQFSGEAIVGTLTGRQLTFLPSSIVSFGFFREAYPDVKVLSRDTGFSRSYGRNPYAGYDRADNPPFLFDGDLDGRLLPKERVAAVTVGEVDLAFPFSVLEKERAVNYSANGRDLVVFFVQGTLSALDRSSIQDSREVGSTGVFDPNLDGQKLTFRPEGDAIVDNETGSVWNILGEAVEGPLSGKRLTPVVHANHFWFSWAAFKPDTLIYQGET